MFEYLDKWYLVTELNTQIENHNHPHTHPSHTHPPDYVYVDEIPPDESGEEGEEGLVVEDEEEEEEFEYYWVNGKSCPRGQYAGSEAIKKGYTICASGEAHARRGLHHESVHYTFGKRNATYRGIYVVYRAAWCPPPYMHGKANVWIQRPCHLAVTTCYGRGQKRDQDRTDILVARLCKRKTL